MNLIKEVIKNLTYVIIISMIFYHYYIPHVIEHRAKNLALLKYSSRFDAMMPLDSLHISNFDFVYLQHGDFDKLNLK